MSAVAASRLRFVTVRDLFRAFPTAAIDVGAEISDEATPDFVRRSAAAGNHRAALSCCAYLLARREAVWWGTQCIRQSELRGAREAECLAAAEAWIREPHDANRRRAMEFGRRSSNRAPATWIALAAGWSGGDMSENSNYRITPPPQMTAQAVRGALLIAVARLPVGEAHQIQSEWVALGLRYAVGNLPPDPNGEGAS
jgi:hypothetical protein